MQFSRSIPKCFIEHLNSMPPWWEMVIDLERKGDVVVALHDGVIDVYRVGQRLARIVWGRKMPYKRNDPKSTYVQVARKYLPESMLQKLRGTSVNEAKEYKIPAPSFFESSDTLNAIVEKIASFSSGEKTGCQSIMLNRHNREVVIDVEMALPHNDKRRMDIVAVKPSEDGSRDLIVMYEAKLVSNPELYNSANNEKSIERQLSRYRKILKNEKSSILAGYKEAIAVAKEITPEARCGCLAVLGRLEPKRLDLYPVPHLLVFPDHRPGHVSTQGYIDKAKEKCAALEAGEYQMRCSG